MGKLAKSAVMAALFGALAAGCGSDREAGGVVDAAADVMPASNFDEVILSQGSGLCSQCDRLAMMGRGGGVTVRNGAGGECFGPVTAAENAAFADLATSSTVLAALAAPDECHHLADGGRELRLYLRDGRIFGITGDECRDGSPVETLIQSLTALVTKYCADVWNGAGPADGGSAG